jgi:hypothetical protein
MSLIERAAAARADAGRYRRDALAAQWQASGSRQVACDTRIELIWTYMQQRRLMAGDRIAPGGVCRCARCGRPGCGGPPG